MEALYAHQGYIKKYSKNTNILKYYYNLKEQISIVIYTHLKDYQEHHSNTVFDPLSPSELP